MNIDKHKYYMAQILGQVFRDKELSRVLGFKGGTALMFFHQLPRFSTDLDFNLLDASQQDKVYNKVKAILSMLKVEISNRGYPNHYETRTLAGTDIRVMILEDMFAHKLCAMGERLSPRDVFDCWFFLQQHTAINPEIVRIRTGMEVDEYSKQCAEQVQNASPKLLMQGLGEVLDTKMKTFVKTKLIQETATALELFSAFPLLYKE